MVFSFFANASILKNDILVCLHNTLQNHFVSLDLSLLLTTSLPKTTFVARAGMWVSRGIWEWEGCGSVV